MRKSKRDPESPAGPGDLCGIQRRDPGQRWSSRVPRWIGDLVGVCTGPCRLQCRILSSRTGSGLICGFRCGTMDIGRGPDVHVGCDAGGLRSLSRTGFVIPRGIQGGSRALARDQDYHPGFNAGSGFSLGKRTTMRNAMRDPGYRTGS